MSAKSRFRQLMLLPLMILAGILLLSVLWEFYLEDIVVPYIYEYYHPEPLYERVEFVITALVFSMIALIIPSMVALRNFKDADQAKEALSNSYDELEQRVQERTRELSDANNRLEMAIAEQTQTEKALRSSEKELRLLSRQLLDAQEKERSRIAMELHDKVSQTLAALKYRIEGTLNASVGNKPDSVELSEILVPEVQKTIDEVRAMYMGLRPSMLDDLGLSATLTWLQRDFQGAHQDIRTRIDNNITDSETPDDLKIVIYRVLQEALENVARHSKADQIHVSLDRSNHTVELTVQDNGSGFRLEDVMSADDSLRGMGLSGMRERVELVGGQFAITSGVGEGTTIHASMPIRQQLTA